MDSSKAQARGAEARANPNPITTPALEKGMGLQQVQGTQLGSQSSLSLLWDRASLRRWSKPTPPPKENTAVTMTEATASSKAAVRGQEEAARESLKADLELVLDMLPDQTKGEPCRMIRPWTLHRSWQRLSLAVSVTSMSSLTRGSSRMRRREHMAHWNPPSSDADSLFPGTSRPFSRRRGRELKGPFV